MPLGMSLFLLAPQKKLRVILILMVSLAFNIICTEIMAGQIMYDDDYNNLQSQNDPTPLYLHCSQDNHLNEHKFSGFNDHGLFCDNDNYFSTTLPRDFRTGNQHNLLSDQDQDRRSQYSKKEQPLPKVSTNRREFQQIKADLKVKQQRHKCKIGDRFQTKNICKYLFTETANYLKMMASANELSPEEKQEAARFLEKKNKINLLTFNQLFRCKKLRSKCLEFYESNQFVCGIFKSRADIKTKLNIIKYLQKVRRIPISNDTTRWKK